MARARFALILATGCGGGPLDQLVATGKALCAKKGHDIECRPIDAHSTKLAPTPSQPFDSITAGGFHACGLTADGEAVCWGRNSQYNHETEPPAGERFSTIDAGADTTCGVRASDGTLVCWGWLWWESGFASLPGDAFRRVALTETGWCGERTDGTIACQVPGYSLPDDQPLTSPLEMDSRGGTACATDQDGRLYCFGRPDWGLLDDVPAGTGYHNLAVGQKHVCVLDRNWRPVCWGYGEFGQTSPPAGRQYRQLASGISFTCGERYGGNDIDCWGCVEEFYLENGLTLEETYDNGPCRW